MYAEKTVCCLVTIAQIAKPRSVYNYTYVCCERIEAKVNDQNHVLSVLSGPAVTYRRNDNE